MDQICILLWRGIGAPAMSTQHALTRDLGSRAANRRIPDLYLNGRDAGGQIVTEGTPEKVAKNPTSHTGMFLKKVLNGRAAKGDGGRREKSILNLRKL